MSKVAMHRDREGNNSASPGVRSERFAAKRVMQTKPASRLNVLDRKK
ncbi:MAG: hypothetical protein F6J93_24200 [Oscillatoria sp. SIO1A7]|nr:hypothetical protein [Oscillatoria sp. SIO1A7]